MLNNQTRRKRRAMRQRARIARQNTERPRLTVFRSGRHIYAQVIVDAEQKTAVSASTLADLKSKMKGKATNKDMAREVGKLVGERALKAGVDTVIFDKGAYKFHGKVASLAEGAREAGLKF